MSFEVPSVLSLSLCLISPHLSFVILFPPNIAITFPLTPPLQQPIHPWGFLPAVSNYQSVGFHCASVFGPLLYRHMDVQCVFPFLHQDTVFCAKSRGISSSLKGSGVTSEAIASSQGETCQVCGLVRCIFSLCSEL